MGKRDARPQPAMFLTKLLTSCVNNRWWMVEAPFVIDSKIVGQFTVPLGFMFNGNSIPRLGWVFSPPSDWLEAAAAHDFLCHYSDFDQKTCDRVYKEVLDAMGMTKVRRGARYGALRLADWIGLGGKRDKSLSQGG